MSHFSVLVAASDEKDLETKLQPYHEYECTGIRDKYVVWVDDIHDDELKNWQADNCGYESFGSYMKDYCGYEEINPTSGKYERLTNPNAKWDWWVVGGRWRNSLLLTNGRFVDSALARDIDWQSIKVKQALDFKQKASDFRAAFESVNQENVAAALDERLKKWYSNSDVAQALTDGKLELAAKCIAAEQPLRESYGPFIEFHEWTCVIGDFDKELERATNKPLTFAFINQKGEWHQRGEMGWFACVSDKQEDYPEKFWAFVDQLDGDQRLTLVDCHI